jgi:nicotinamide riboside kinase
MARVAQVNAAGFCVCLSGSESSGKTTLARALAERLGVPLVAEAARDYLLRRRERGSDDYGRDDLLAIAALQEQAESNALAATNRRRAIVVCDTDLVVIAIWWRERYGVLPPELDAALARRTARGYLLTRPEMDWQPDPLREHPDDRDRLHQLYRNWFERDRFEWVEVAGSPQVRLDRAIAQLDSWRKRRSARSS